MNPHQRATSSGASFLSDSSQSVLERLDHDMSEMASEQTFGVSEQFVLACRLLADEGHARSLAGQVTMRAEQEGTFWTNAFSAGLAEACKSNMVRIDHEMNVLEGKGPPNPGVRFHLWIYSKRPALQSIVHTHPPFASALSMTGKTLKIAHMDATMFYDDCAFLADWPGVPVANEEGRIISEALGTKRTILLSHHGILTTGTSLTEALYLAIHLERACEMQMRASAVGEVQSILPALATEAHAFMSKPSMMSATVNYWFRQIAKRHPDALSDI